MQLLSKSTMQKLIFLILLILVLLIFEQGFRLGTINLWSLHYLHGAVDLLPIEQQLSPPPSSHQRAALWLARAAQRRGDLVGARRILAPLVAEGNTLATSALGDLWAAQGDLQEAIQSWGRAGNIANITAAAQQATESGHLDDALLAYETNLRLKSQAGVLPLANFLWDQMSDRPAAEAVLRLALADYPTSRDRAHWLRLLSVFVYRQGRWDEAEILYRQYLAKNPDNLSAWIDLGWLTYNRGDGLATAQAIFEQAIAVDPERGEGYFAMAQVLVNAKCYADADAWFQQAIVRNPDNKGWDLARANAQRAGGNLLLALKLYQESLSRFPEHAPTYYEQAWAYYLNEQLQEAKVAIKRALQLLDKPDPRYYIRAGYIYEKADDTEIAIDYYKLALSLDPNNKEAIDGLQRLQGSQ